jgi:peptide/nickel transport system ATP-binding protein
MRGGEVMEQLEADALRAGIVQHDYTRQLLAATAGYRRDSASPDGCDRADSPAAPCPTV